MRFEQPETEAAKQLRKLAGPQPLVPLHEAKRVMNALLVIAALFGGLLWAGRSQRRYDQIVYDYDPDPAAAYCDCDCNDDGAAADTSGDSSGGGE